jgi:hypothetical protein
MGVDKGDDAGFEFSQPFVHMLLWDRVPFFEGWLPPNALSDG